MQFNTTLSILVILTLGALLLSTSLGDAALWDRDEAIYGACAKEMLLGGDWIVPRLGKESSVNKPPLGFWLMALSYQVFGVNEFAARFCSVVAGLLTLLLTFQIGSRFFSRGVGLSGSAILLTTVLFVLCGRAATLDSVLLMFLTGAMLVYMHGDGTLKGEERSESVGSRLGLRYSVLLYALLGLAVLTKGPVAYLLPISAILIYRIIFNGRTDQREHQGVSLAGFLSDSVRILLSEMRNIHFLAGLGLVFLINGPWILLVGLGSDGKWLHGFFWVHNVLRFMEPFEGHGGPIFYYLGALAAGLFPWSVLAVPAVLMTLRRAREPFPIRNGTLFLICWIVVHFAFYSFASTKLPHYILPIYPACAIGTAILLRKLPREFDSGLARALRFSSVCLIVNAFLIGAGAYLTARFLVPGAEAVGFLSLPLLASGLVTLLLWNRNYPLALVSFAVGGFLFLFLIFPVGSRIVDPFQNARTMLSALEGEEFALATFGFFEPSWAFYAPQGCEELDGIQEAAEFLEREDAVLVTTGDGKKRLEEMLPGRLEEITAQRRFLKTGWIYLIREYSGHHRQR